MNNHSVDKNPEGIKDIPKWTKKYAESRTGPVIVYFIIFLLLSASIGGASLLTGWLYMKGYMVLFGLTIIVDVLLILLVIFLSIPPNWGGINWPEKISHRLFYLKEGNVQLQFEETPKSKRNLYIAIVLFLFCVEADIVLGLAGLLPIKYMQPISAIYVVPFLIFIIHAKGKMDFGLVSYLWPFLYALHAILVVAGVPIQFGGHLEAFNMLIPIVGYGMLCAIIGHIYNRFALRKLRQLSREEN